MEGPFADDRFERAQDHLRRLGNGVVARKSPNARAGDRRNRTQNVKVDRAAVMISVGPGGSLLLLSLGFTHRVFLKS